jgi:4-carboxymuconolactone decarboxylase
VKEAHVARYEPVNFDQLSSQDKALYDVVKGARPKLVGPFSALMHNPPLAEAVNKVVDAIRKDGKLEKRLYELIVLITVRHASAGYAWAVHDPLGRKAGLSDDVVDAIRDKRKPPFTKPDEKAIYEAVTELLETNRIGDAAYQALVKQFGLRETIEIVTCVGLYCMVGSVINAFEVPTPNGEKPF